MRRIFILIFFSFPLILSAQKKDSAVYIRTGFICEFTYTGYFPNSDLAQRYGYFNSIGTGCYYKTGKNWIFGLEGGYHFGNRIKEAGIFDAVSDTDWYAVNTQGALVEVTAQMRGMTLTAKVGKIIPFGKLNANSGIMISAGIGYTQHYIRLTNQTNDITALHGDARYGYDRLAGGLNLSQFIGFQYLGSRKRVNFYGGIEFNQGLTQGMRDWNYDTMTPGNESRFDGRVGIRVGWLLPIYTGTAKAGGGYRFR